MRGDGQTWSSFEAAEFLFVSANLVGERFERVLELFDVGGEAGEGEQLA